MASRSSRCGDGAPLVNSEPRPRLIRGSFLLCLALILGFAPRGGQGQTLTNVVDAFNTNSYPGTSITTVWGNWFGSAFQSLALDATSDASTNPASGSLKIVANFPVATDQFEVWDGINGIRPGLNALQFTNFQCDVRFAPGSATNSSGRFGSVEFGVPTPGYGQSYFGSVTVAASNTNWVHVSLALNANANTNLQNITGLLIHIWGAGLVGPSTLWVDNLRFIGPATNTGTVTLTPTNTHQTLEGFGASTAFYQGWLTAHPYKNEIFTNMFVGLGLDILRLGNWFRYPGTFSFDADSVQIVSNANRVLGAPIPILMSSWSPPAFLKSNGKVASGTLITTNGGIAYTNFANYWYDSLLAYKSNGITPTWISIQNEPDIETGYDSCKFLPTETTVTNVTSSTVTNLSVITTNYVTNVVTYASYSKALDATCQRLTNMLSPPKLLGPEVLGIGYNNLQNYAATMNSNQIYGVDHHLYHGGTQTETSIAPDTFIASMQAVKSVFPSKPKWQTEYYRGDALQTAWLIHNSLTVEEVTAYLFWDLFWDRGGLVALEFPWDQKQWTNAPAGTPTQAHGYWLTDQYYALKHFSYFTAPGYKRIEAEASAPSVLASAFLSPDNLHLVVVLINNSTSAPAVLSLSSGSFPAASSAVYQTAGTNKFKALGAAGPGLSVSLPAYSMTTVVLDAPAPGPIFSLKASDDPGASSWNAALNWTNDATGLAAPGGPTNGYSYANRSFTLRTPLGPGNSTFGGDVLTLTPATVSPTAESLLLKGDSGAMITISNLVLNGGTIGNGGTASGGATTQTLAGAISVAAPARINLTQSGRSIVVAANLRGAGALTNTTLNGLGGSGIITYSGSNNAFTGPMIVTGSAGNATTLAVDSEARLGGNPAVFNAAQLTLDNGIFQPRASFALDDPNRGVTIAAGGGTFSIPAGITLTVSNPIAGPGNLVSAGGGTLVLAATNAATGNLIVSNGTLALVGNAALKSQFLGVSNTATLDVTGLNVPLAVSNRIALAGNLLARINRTNSSSRLSASNFVFSGTLTLSNTGPALAAGDRFQLFAAIDYSGAFASLIPGVPGANLVWDTSQLVVDGSLGVAGAFHPTLTGLQLAGNRVVIRGTNGGAPGSFCYTLATTNPALPLASWVNIGTNQFGAGAGFGFTNAWNAAAPRSFFILRLP